MKTPPCLRKFSCSLLFALTLWGAVAPASGQVWTEIGDAGDYITNAQTTAGYGPLTQIKGNCPRGDHDMYLISITNAAAFKATVTAPAGNDTLMALFDTNGMGIAFNDDTPVPYNGLSTLDFTRNGIPLTTGTYILGLMSSGQMWDSDGGHIWNRQPWDNERAPDGPGQGQPMTSYWGTAEHDVMNYVIVLTGATFAISGLPPKIDLAPVDRAVEEGQPATFSAAASGSQPLSFQWQSSTNGGTSYQILPGATNASYTIAAAHPSADNQKRLRVVVSNALGSVNSAAAILTVLADKVAPSVVFAGSLGHPTAFLVQFSKGVDPASALAASNYSLAGATITNLSLTAPNRVVLCTSAALGQGTLTVHDIVDLADARNVLSPNPSTMPLDIRWHGVVMRKYDGIAGTTLDTLSSSAKFPNSPDSVQYLASLETPSNIDNNYGAVLLGYLAPPVTGDYTFYIASDDNGQLLLSPDENPANAVIVASEPGWDPPRNWLGHPELQSAPQPLVAGKKYYFEAWVKQGGGGDNLAVTWVKPGETFNPNQPPIDFEYLLPFGTVPGGNPLITQQPASVTATAGSTVALTTTMVGTPPFAYQWFRNGVAVPGATQPVFKFTATHSVAGNYRLAVTNVFNWTWSSNAAVKVQNQPGIWVEDGDAGDTLATAQAAIGSGPLTEIHGSIPDGWDHDLYQLVVTNYLAFSAQVTAPANGNSRLALFDAHGLGVVFNDDISDSVPLSGFDYATSKLPATNGVYYLGIMTRMEMPASTVNSTNVYIWTEDNPTAQKRPDGPGAANPLVGFGGYGGSLPNYTIALTGVAFVPEPVVPTTVLLKLQRSGANLILSWPAGLDTEGFSLQETDQVAVPSSWQPSALTPTVSGNSKSVTLTPTAKTKFYRLAHP